MGLNNILEVSDLLVKYWHSQGIIPGESFRPNEFVGLLSRLFTVEEFLFFYSVANGMDNKYPDEYDNNGFLFYPADGIYPFLKENDVLIIGDYLNKCWWYGVRLLNEDAYEIIIIEGRGLYTFITNSLAEFFAMYMSNDERIYPRYDD